MCGRYTQTLSSNELSKRFGADYAFNLEPSFNIAPSQLVCVVVKDNIKLLKLMKWGLIPFWSKEPSIGNKLINARAETILEKPSFRNSFKSKRCLIPADSFYEWSLQEGAKKKTPYRFVVKDQRTFCFAGLWDSWKDPEGKIIESVTVITTQPNELLRRFHDRMPVILPFEAEDLWLSSENQDLEKLYGLLKPYPANLMDVYQISDRVNSPRNNDKECILPV